MYNHTEKECNKEKEVVAYCKFINHIGQGVDSEHMTLHLIPGKKKITVYSCSTGHTNIFIKSGATNSSPVTSNRNTFCYPTTFVSFSDGKFVHTEDNIGFDVIKKKIDKMPCLCCI